MSILSDKRSIEYTTDGSQTVFSERHQQHYHSINGAIQESEHVFIDAGLRATKANPLKVLEVGLGTCLNALLTLRESIDESRSILYHALELNPLPVEVYDTLNYLKEDRPAVFEHLNSMHSQVWDDQWHAIIPSFSLRKTQVALEKWTTDDNYDLIYFDAFGPGCQPELWTPEIFQSLYTCTSVGGVLTTYSCKGDVRRGMMAAGYKVEKIPGPAGKREMLRAKKE